MLYEDDNEIRRSSKRSLGQQILGGTESFAQKRPGRDESTRRMVPVVESGDATASASSLFVSLLGSQRDSLSSKSSTLFPLG